MSDDDDLDASLDAIGRIKHAEPDEPEEEPKPARAQRTIGDDTDPATAKAAREYIDRQFAHHFRPQRIEQRFYGSTPKR
jgi:hypothetical protein